MAYPGAIDSPGGTAAQGTNSLTSPDHSLDHRTLGSAVVAIETFLGTNSGTNVFGGFTAGQQVVSANSGTLGTVLTKGTINNGILGSPTINGGTLGGAILNNGTISGGMLGTATIQGGTANNQTLGTPTLQGAVVNTANVVANAISQGSVLMGTGNGTFGTSL